MASLSGVRQLSHLQTLLVCSNKLSSLTTLGGLTALTHLDVSQNQLETIAGVAALPSLKELTANSNRLTSLRALSRCTALTELQVRPNLPRLHVLEASLRLRTFATSTHQALFSAGAASSPHSYKPTSWLSNRNGAVAICAGGAQRTDELARARRCASAGVVQLLLKPLAHAHVAAPPSARAR